MISIDQYRSAIGLYVHRAHKMKNRLDVLLIDGRKVSLAVRITLFLLLVIGNVERHPGPVTLTSLASKVKDLEENFESMQEEFQRMKDENSVLKNICVRLSELVENMQSQQRRENIILHNVPASEGKEDWNETETKVKDYLRSIGLDEIPSIERTHRLNANKPDSPVILKLSHFKDKQKIMKQAKEKKKERQKALNPEEKRKADKHNHEDIYLTDDLTTRVRKVRQLLRPTLQEALSAGKKAHFSFDKVVIDGVAHWYDDVKKCVTTIKPKVLSCMDVNLNLAELTPSD